MSDNNPRDTGSSSEAVIPARFKRRSREGRRRIGNQRWDDFEVQKMKTSVPIEGLLGELGRDGA